MHIFQTTFRDFRQESGFLTLLLVEKGQSLLFTSKKGKGLFLTSKTEQGAFSTSKKMGSRCGALRKTET